MSYRAAIGVQLPDNTIKAIYIDWGHPLSIPSIVNPNATPAGKYLQENCPTFGLALGIVNKENAYVFDNLYQFTMDYLEKISGHTDISSFFIVFNNFFYFR